MLEVIMLPGSMNLDGHGLRQFVAGTIKYIDALEQYLICCHHWQRKKSPCFLMLHLISHLEKMTWQPGQFVRPAYSYSGISPLTFSRASRYSLIKRNTTPRQDSTSLI